MSSVYLARHVMIDRLMAIKTLRSELAKDPVQRDRFLREARAVNRINHENIVEITDFGETDDGLVYLVMEHVPGKPLLEVMKAGPMPIPRAFHIARQCATALGRAHQMGVVHRDLKPENILLVQRRSDPDFIKVLDFGIAKILDAPSLTASQQIFGTPGYIAPEYIQSTEIDGRADIYSLGVILYELVTGALPFDYEYPGDLLLKHVNEMPVAPRERLETVPVPVEELLLRCLRKDADRRFRDAYHFIEELEAVAASLLTPEKSETSSRPPAAAASRATLPPADAPARPTLIESVGSQTTVEPTNDAASTATAGRTPRPAIPEAPSYESVERLVPGQGASVRPGSAATPFDPSVDGIMGVRRWRRRFDVLSALLDSVALTSDAVPPHVVEAMSHSRRTLEAFEARAKVASARQLEVEAIQDRARDLRAVLGQRIDALAGHLSHLQGELERLRIEPAALEKTQSRRAEGSGEASLWARAASDAQLEMLRRQVTDSERELGRLGEELERRSGEGEMELERASRRLDEEMGQVEAMADALREPLDVAERFVLTGWQGPLSPAPGDR